jgi:thymidylate synthase
MLMRRGLPKFENIDQILVWATEECLEYGTPVAPRHQPTYELLGTGFSLTNPRARIPNFPSRKWSLALALGELCWHLKGASDLESLAYYAPRWRHYSDNGITVEGSCYGKAAFDSARGASQWEYAKHLLTSDPATRRAVLIFDRPKPSDQFTVDKSCLTSMQFLIRENRLHAVVTMRSNDLYLGVPYDVFNFTMLQELMALEVGAALGTYVHFVGSLHLYERDIPRARASYSSSALHPLPMEPIPGAAGMKQFVDVEAAIRTGKPVDLHSLDPFWVPYATVLKEYRRSINPMVITR